MNEELTPLEALNELFEDFMIMRNCLNDLDDETQKSRDFYNKWANEHKIIIETALKDYETLQDDFNKLYERTYKELKALEIIKEKNVNVLLIKQSSSYGEFLMNCKNSGLPQKEYDLLKEVLL